MKKKIIAVTCVLMLCLGLIGCGAEHADKPQELIRGAAPRYNDGLIRVGMIQTGKESDWRDANTNDYLNTFTKERGYDLIYIDGNSSSDRQVKAMYDLIQQKVDYIILQPIVETGWEDAIHAAKESGIPVIVADRKVSVDETEYVSWIGSDFEEEGKKAGYWLQEYLEEKEQDEDPVRIVVLLGTEGSTSVIGRSKGFEYVAAQHPNWEILEQVDADFTTAKGYEVMKHLLEKYPDIDVVISQNDDMTFGALEAMEEAGVATGTDGDVVLVSYDAVKTALEKVGEGRINVDIECNPLQGQYIDMIIKNLESGVPIEKKYYTVERIFTPENVGLVLDDRLY